MLEKIFKIILLIFIGLLLIMQTKFIMSLNILVVISLPIIFSSLLIIYPFFLFKLYKLKKYKQLYIYSPFFILLVGIFIFIIFIIIAIDEGEKDSAKNHFEYISSMKFPKNGKFIKYDCFGGFGGGGYTCNGTFTVDLKTYQKIKTEIELNSSIAKYHKNAEMWNLRVLGDNETISFEYIDF